MLWLCPWSHLSSAVGTAVESHSCSELQGQSCLWGNTSSIQSCQTGSHLCVFQAKGWGLGGQRENWGTVWQIQISISVVGKFRYLGSLLPGSLHYNASIKKLLKTLSKPFPLQSSDRESREEASSLSFDGVFPKYYSSVLKGALNHPISIPQYHTSENVLSRICRQRGLKPWQMALLTTLVKCFHWRLQITWIKSTIRE